MRLYDSLYETALKQEIPRPVIDELVRIFANDVDFGRAVSGGDSFEAFYDDSEEGEGHNQLLYAAITARNETFRYYRFQTPDDGLIDYYDQDGRSTRKFLVRMPIVGGRFTSGFGIRFHPILGYSRPHTGVDWAAPIGTPIFAAGSGTIIQAGWDSGYGRRIEIQHANGYITTYNHMSGFARGATEGAHVRQGQVIGYLGQTGLATGPHLHYEILVNGHFVDPMRVKLARTREFDGRMLANFKRERDRIDGLVLKAPNANRVAARQQILIALPLRLPPLRSAIGAPRQFDPRHSPVAIFPAPAAIKTAGAPACIDSSNNPCRHHSRDPVQLSQIRNDHRIVGADNLRPDKHIAVEPDLAGEVTL